MQNKNVLYITMEMAEKKIAERIDANLMNISLDDLGNETLTDWYREILTSLINSRYNAKKLTFITTNYFPLYLLQKEDNKNHNGMVVKSTNRDISNKEAFKELTTLDSRYGSHIVSRLAEMTIPFSMFGMDKRKIKGVATR